jgi:hypothetical protein
LRFGENLKNCLNFSKSVLIYSIYASEVRNLAECAEKWWFFGRFDKKAFSVEMPETSFLAFYKPWG